MRLTSISAFRCAFTYSSILFKLHFQVLTVKVTSQQIRHSFPTSQTFPTLPFSALSCSFSSAKGLPSTAVPIQFQQMYTQRQEQKIKTIDLNEYLDGFHNYRSALNQKQSLKSHPFTVKLRNHLNVRAETCFSIQSCQPQSRLSTRNGKQNRYSKEALPGQTDIDAINLDEFMHVVLNREEAKEEEKTHQFIRSLNGTWFQGTDDNYKTKQITSTLGIKKSRSLLRPRTERYNPENLRDRVDFTKEFRPNGLFPSRKVNSHNRKKLAKNPSSTHQHLQSPNKNNQGSLKYQIVKTIKHQIQNSKMPAKSTHRVVRCTFAAIANNFNNERILSHINKQAVVKGKKMMIHD